MKFTLSWLKEYLDTNASAKQIAETLTAIGIEVESLEDKAAELKDFTVAEILEANPHPNADRLRVCKVKTHSDERQIVCGAANARVGLKVVLADIGVTIPNGNFVIKKSKIRGVESNGMLCSADELGLGEDGDGIIELPQNAKVGDSIVSVLGLDEVVFDVAITPNRGDCLGIYGIARDLAAAGVGTLRHPEGAVATEGSRSFATLRTTGNAGRKIRLETKDCPLFIGRLIQGVKNGPSPEWLQKRLKAVGQRPISTLVDITNFITIAFGRPLHVYDADKLHGDIIVRASKKDEAFDALNDKHYDLPDGLCIIADEKGVLGLGGVVGGVPSGCTETTKNVFLEAAWFEPEAIMKTGRLLQVESDARYRFERTVDPQFVQLGAELATRMILELCGGAASALEISGKAPDTTRTIPFSPSDVKTLGGADVAAAESKKILESLGFSVTEGATWQVKNPSWRPDMAHTSDLVEEILRIKGYGAIPETPLPHATASVGGDVTATLRRTLASRGLLECYHYGFIDRKDALPFAVPEKLIALANPISADLDTMRPNLLPGLLRALSRNLARDAADLGLYEVGTVFHGVGLKDQPLVAAAVRLGHEKLHWSGKPRAFDIYDAKADLFAALEGMGFAARAQVSADVPAWYHPGKAGRLGLGPKVTLGYFGELHPAILRAFDLEKPVMAFELFVEQVPVKEKTERQALKLSDYQAVRRDFAFVVDGALPAEELLASVRNAEKTLVRDIALFDLYEGKGIPEGKKSLAVAVTLQADDRTLTEEEITRIHAAIVASAQKLGASIRQ